MRDLLCSNATDRPITRREALRCTTVTAIALATGACNTSTTTPVNPTNGRLRVRVTAPTQSIEPGLYPLGLGGSRDGLFYVPTSYRPTEAAPIALLLHGAGRSASEMVTPIRPFADTTGLVLVAPDSRGSTWDAINGDYFDDVNFIDRALGFAFSRVRADATRVRIAGFSDGGTYSLSLGLINGDFFSRVVGISPGFVADGPRFGKPKIFITHGTRDPVLPIESTSRVIVPALRALAYEVEYTEFDGGHGTTPELLEQTIRWMVT